jgi:hypothetical protein
MQRVQVQLSDEQAAHLARRAATRGTTIAGAILDAVDAQLAADEKQRRIDVALAALKKPAFRSVLADPSESLEESLARAVEERIGRG